MLKSFPWPPNHELLTMQNQTDERDATPCSKAAHAAPPEVEPEYPDKAYEDLSCPYDGDIVAAFELMTDPPPRLTRAGMKMLLEIWEALGKPSSLLPPKNGFAPLDDLPSHVENHPSAAQVRAILLRGGYLHIEGHPDDSEESLCMANPPWHIEGLALSAKAFDALREAGHISPGPKAKVSRKRVR